MVTSIKTYKISIAVLLALLAVSSGTGAYLYQARTNEISRSANLNRQISTLNNQIDSLKTDISIVQNGDSPDSQASLKTRVALLENEIVQLNATINQLQATSQLQATEIKDLNSKIQDLQSQIDQLLHLPLQSIAVSVVGQQFSWTFTCSTPCDNSTPGVLTVPHDRTVVMSVTSLDVYHTIAIPTLGLKADAILGRTSIISFKAPAGTYAILCVELCGPGHANMTASLVVV
jgi:heme/copper-type cytochrome/quinol oxidase subunit 2